MNMSKAQKISAILFLIGLVAAVVGFFVLPDSLVMQITATGDGGTVLPKLLGLLAPLAVIALSFFLGKEKGDFKALFVAGVGLLMYVFIFIVNL